MIAFPRTFGLYLLLLFEMVHQVNIRFRKFATSFLSGKYDLHAAIVVSWKIPSAKLVFCLSFPGCRHLWESLGAFLKQACNFWSLSWILWRSCLLMYPDEEEMCKPHTVKLNSGNTNFFSFNKLFLIFLTRWTESKNMYVRWSALGKQKYCFFFFVTVVLIQQYVKGCYVCRMVVCHKSSNLESNLNYIIHAAHQFCWQPLA